MNLPRLKRFRMIYTGEVSATAFSGSMALLIAKENLPHGAKAFLASEEDAGVENAEENFGAVEFPHTPEARRSKSKRGGKP